jgi:SAM-dependent methyltransferase
MPTAEEIKSTQRSQWAGAAPAWDKWFEWNERNVGGAMARWCCDALQLTPGMRVLDIACGTGSPSLQEAARVTPGGRVLATDLAPEMFAVAERRAREAGLANLEFRAMDAEALDLPDASFDAVSFLFALMFCPSPDRAVAEIHRVLAPGGRFALTVWDAPEKNSFFTTIGKPVAQFLQAPPPDPRAPGGFRFAPPGELEVVLRAGGFSDFTIESRTVPVECESVDQYFEMTTEMAGPLRTKLAGMAAGDRDRLKAMVVESARPFVTNGAVRLSLTPLCVTGRK